MSIIIAIVLIYLFVLFMRSGNKQSTNHPQTAGTAAGCPGTYNATGSIHCTVGSTGSYDHILGSLQQIVDRIARNVYGQRIEVLVIVKKIDSQYCSIVFQVSDVSFERYNITFGSEFKKDHDEIRTFETKQATGFITPEAVKSELLLQFNWYDIATDITELQVYSTGGYAGSPMVVMRFGAKYKG